jgi:hypothetical protein
MHNLPLTTRNHSSHSLAPNYLNHHPTGQSTTSMAQSCKSIARGFIQGSIEQVRQKTANVLKSGVDLNSSSHQPRNMFGLPVKRSREIPVRAKAFEAAINQSVQRLRSVKSQDCPLGSTKTKAYETQWDLAKALSPARIKDIAKNLQSTDLAKRSIAEAAYSKLLELDVSSEMMVPVFRGVSGGEPGETRYTESNVSGKTLKEHGYAKAPGTLTDVYQHAHQTSAYSIFLSFTTDLEVAARFSGRDGRVLVAYVPNGSVVMSPNGHGENEVLIPGKVYFNHVLNPEEGLADLSVDDLEPEFKEHDEYVKRNPGDGSCDYFPAY